MKLLITLGVILIISAVAESRKCYQCTTKGVSACSAADLKTCSNPENKCMSIEDGYTSTTENCSISMNGLKFCKEAGVKAYGCVAKSLTFSGSRFNGVLLNTCETDGCNSPFPKQTTDPPPKRDSGSGRPGVKLILLPIPVLLLMAKLL